MRWQTSACANSGAWNNSEWMSGLNEWNFPGVLFRLQDVRVRARVLNGLPGRRRSAIIVTWGPAAFRPVKRGVCQMTRVGSPISSSLFLPVFTRVLLLPLRLASLPCGVYYHPPLAGRSWGCVHVRVGGIVGRKSQIVDMCEREFESGESEWIRMAVELRLRVLFPSPNVCLRRRQHRREKRLLVIHRLEQNI